MKTKHQTGPGLLMAVLCTAAAPALAIGCDELRSGIDARIRATGVGNFILTVVPANAAGVGSVVGSCEQGAKKIYYVKGTLATSAAAVTRPAPAPAQPPNTKPKATAPEVITECDDGTSVTHGECKKP